MRSRSFLLRNRFLSLLQIPYLSVCHLQALGCGVVERVLSWARVKSQAQIAKKQQGSRHSKLRGIPKLDDANEAGGKNALECTLIVTEGDSAKTLAVSGLGVVGRDYYGVFPLRGKLLNVREASHNQVGWCLCKVDSHQRKQSKAFLPIHRG